MPRLAGGGGGIRTHGTLARTTVFETAPFDHSGTPPQSICFNTLAPTEVETLNEHREACNLACNHYRSSTVRSAVSTCHATSSCWPCSTCP